MKKLSMFYLIFVVGLMAGYAWAYFHFSPYINKVKTLQSSYDMLLQNIVKINQPVFIKYKTCKKGLKKKSWNN